METNFAPEQSGERKPYQKPELVEYGALKDLTLGDIGHGYDGANGSYAGL